VTKRWHAAIDGTVVAVIVGADATYLAVEHGQAKQVIALSDNDGSVRWTTTLTGNGDWNGEFALADTAAGPITSYADGGGGHLLLLDAATGKTKWDTPIDEAAYELDGEGVPGVAYVLVTEDDGRYLDVATGKLRSDDRDIVVLGDRTAILEDNALVVGADLFHPSKPGTRIPLSGKPSDVATDGTTIFVAEGTDVVGVVDGREQWRTGTDRSDRRLGVVGRDIIVVERPTTRRPRRTSRTSLDPEPHLVGTSRPHRSRSMYLYDSGGGTMVSPGRRRRATTPGTIRDLVAVALTPPMGRRSGRCGACVCVRARTPSTIISLSPKARYGQCRCLTSQAPARSPSTAT
jgi:hypothetical protein